MLWIRLVPLNQLLNLCAFHSPAMANFDRAQLTRVTPAPHRVPAQPQIVGDFLDGQ